MPAPEAPYRRFLRSYSVCEATGCWLWTGQKHANGYGVLKVFGQMMFAHRFSCELHQGPIAEGMHVLHSCDVKACVNPAHVRVGTHAENMAEAASRGLMRKGETHPMHGRRNPRPKQAKPVRVLGTVYESQKSAERALGLGAGTVRFWVVNHPEKAQRV